MFVPANNFVERATKESSEPRRYCDDGHYQSYLKTMKENIEKVSHLSIPNPHRPPEMVSVIVDIYMEEFNAISKLFLYPT